MAMLLECYICKPSNVNNHQANHQKLGKDKEGSFPYSFPWEHGPANSSVLDFWPLEPWDNKFLLLGATEFVAFYYGRPRKQIQAIILEGIYLMLLRIQLIILLLLLWCSKHLRKYGTVGFISSTSHWFYISIHSLSYISGYERSSFLITITILNKCTNLKSIWKTCKRGLSQIELTRLWVKDGLVGRILGWSPKYSLPQGTFLYKLLLLMEVANMIEFHSCE